MKIWTIIGLMELIKNCSANQYFTSAEEKLAKLQPHTKGNHEGLTEEEDEDEDEEYQLYAYENEEELQEKLVSLYSNQPETIEQGLKSAYKSLGTNFKLTKSNCLN